jgi:hypothetical protein
MRIQINYAKSKTTCKRAQMRVIQKIQINSKKCIKITNKEKKKASDREYEFDEKEIST